MKRIFVFIVTVAIFICTSAQEVEHRQVLSFEENVVPGYVSNENSRVEISERHHRIGQRSLSWEFNEGGTLSFNKDLGFETDSEKKGLYISTFITWVYNENPMDDQATFNFYKGNKLCSYFKMNLNFKGWRAAWVTFERDMKGIPEEGMDKLTIVAPNKKGKLFFDHLITAAKTDARQQTADLQVPFVNKNTKSHWLLIYKSYLNTSDMSLQPITSQDVEEMKIIEERFKNSIYKKNVFSEKQLNSIKKKFLSYDIKYDKDGFVTGKPIFYKSAGEAYEFLNPPIKNHDTSKAHKEQMKGYFNFMYNVASAYNDAVTESHKSQLEHIFMALYDNITDQGVIYGSCFGNIHHYGYSFRDYYTSLYLMKDVLRKAGKLTEASLSLRWYAMTNEVYKKPIVNGVSMDALNTTTTGRAASILIMEDSPEKVRLLKSFKRWLDYGCLPAPGLTDAFKSDGASFHHANIYPGYSVGGLDGATNMINLLSRTSFAVCREAHETVKKVMLTMRFYCNTVYYPLVLSARHPTGNGAIHPEAYFKMALAGSPDGKNEIDKEMAEAFLRLYPAEKNGKLDNNIVKKLKKEFSAEESPNGNIALGYGCVSSHRRGDWCLTVKGHSRYLWGAEHYDGANKYGRYLGFGAMNLMAPRNRESITAHLSSGWIEEGFDWGRIPGTTAIHLPIEKLEADIKKVDSFAGVEEMLLSDEYFAGGLSQQGDNGNFGMILHEHDKYNGSHRARKSYHFFDEEVVCLGSNIENDVKDYSTETTIFQLNLEKESDKQFWAESLNYNYCMDHLGNGYYFPKEMTGKILYDKNLKQMSLRSTDGQHTEGAWVTLSVNHGNAPKDEDYEYAILPKTEIGKLSELALKPDYEVLKKDRQAHIVKRGEMTSYVLFESIDNLSDGLILKTDTACLLMVKEELEKIVLTVCNPDLALYRGVSDEKFDRNGKRIERSVYSRDWIANEAMSVPVVVTLRGSWNVEESDDVKVIENAEGKTIIKVNCREGRSFDLLLKKL